MEEITTPVTQELSEKQVPFRVFKHPGKLHSLEQAAEERHQRPSQVVRSIVFRLEKGEYVMVLVAGPQQISWRALRTKLGRSRLTMASPEEVFNTTGYERGAVSPYGLPYPMRILVDEKVFAEEEVSLGSGIQGVTVIMHSAYLKDSLGEIEIGRFVEQ